MKQLQVRKDHFQERRIVDTDGASPALAVGEVRVKLSRFAFTANNITYAVAGDMLGYWQFFPPIGDDTEGWGVIPVWGFAEVVESSVEELPVGEKLFGYFPPANELIMMPDRVSAQAFIDGAAHRSQLPPGYNRYRRVTAEAGYNPASDDERMLLWPLYATAYCLGDALFDNDWYGAEQVLVLSASSKTSIGLGYALAAIEGAPKSIGVTSKRNNEFVASLNLFDQTHCYDDLSILDVSIPTVIVDMSGNTDVMAALHGLLKDNMRHTINVGLTHWEEAAPKEGIISERSEMFFAPGHMQKRSKEWGPEEFDRRSSEFVASAVKLSGTWLSLASHSGLQGLSDVYDDVCNGCSAPNEGILIDMADEK